MDALAANDRSDRVDLTDRLRSSVLLSALAPLVAAATSRADMLMAVADIMDRQSAAQAGAAIHGCGFGAVRGEAARWRLLAEAGAAAMRQVER